MTRPSAEWKTRPPVQAPYPEKNDEIVRSYGLIYNPDVIRTLNMVRDELFGRAPVVLARANEWSDNQVMIDDMTAIATAQSTVAGFWGGRAADQYNTFSGNVTAVLQANQERFGDMANLLGECAAEVYDTYAQAIVFIGECASEVVSITGGVVEIAAPPAAIALILNALSGFVNSVANLVSESVRKVGVYAKDGQYFKSYASDFTQPPKAAADGSGVLGDPGAWTVKPAQDPPPQDQQNSGDTVVGRG